MSNFETNADLQAGYYGRYRYDAKNKVYVFEPLGKQVTVDDIVDTKRHHVRLTRKLGIPKAVLFSKSFYILLCCHPAS